MDWMDELSEQARTDMWYLKCLAQVQAREQDFLAIRELLTEQQRQQLDDYIAACEELEHALTPIAYRMGRDG